MNNNISNVSFGAYISPATTQDMESFKKYLTQKTGPINEKTEDALGYFIIDQSKNDYVDLQYKHTKNGDSFAVFPMNKPEEAIYIDGNEKFVSQAQKEIDEEIEKFLEEHPDMETNGGFMDKMKLSSLKKKKNKIENQKFEMLPDAMKKAGEIATILNDKVSKGENFSL